MSATAVSAEAAFAPRALVSPAAILAIAFMVPLLAPNALVPALVLALGAACIGAVRAIDAGPATIIRSILLAASVFGYPFFLGGRFLPWVALLATAALTIGGWVVAPAWRPRMISAQVLAIALAMGCSSAAAQFFFPQAWVLVAIGTVLTFLALLAASPAWGRARFMPSPRACAIVLIVSELLLVLRELPTHWVINGAIITLAFAASMEDERVPRILCLVLLTAVLAFGMFS